jgi:predicted HTH domain antitoxin
MKIILDIDDKFNNDYTEFDLKMYAAVGLYKEGIMSTGDLAKAVGISRIDFMSEMGKYGCGICDMTKEEIQREIEYAER